MTSRIILPIEIFTVLEVEIGLQGLSGNFVTAAVVVASYPLIWYRANIIKYVHVAMITVQGYRQKLSGTGASSCVTTLPREFSPGIQMNG